ncbi:septation protein A [Ideonella paludis]|uniref:Inner membrane-spanning protein YciB n=1 Tax=Ideonella paludis TaxID=1233411 RepID=A0ABS5E1U5_9BURK|nr:septation protein A [Ideonella paludis]MBQ0937289.1 septation protein A [Ideonella paludis]
MKLLLDFLPLILFFATFKGAENNSEIASQWATEHFGVLVSGGVVGPKEAPVLLATIVVIIATLAQVAFLKLKGRKVDLMLWVSLGLVVVLGGLTVWFHNETFIKWKPSGLYWAFGLVLWFSQAVLGKNLLKSMLSAELDLPAKVWRQLNSAWVLFFGLMGLLNLWVAYTFELSTWVNFKVFGATALIFAFTIAQGLVIAKHLPPDESADTGTPKP